MYKEDENKNKRPIFFVSKSLFDVETRYNHLEQVALALRVATKKLFPYFQAHPIIVLTDLPIRSTIHKYDLSERMAVTPQSRGSVDFPSTHGIQVDIGLPDATTENRAESPLYGELYPKKIPT